MEINGCINYLLTNAQNAVSLRFKAMLQPYGVTPAQYMVLYFLNEEKSLPPSRLAQLCRLDASTMTGLLARMEKKGLVERSHSESDRRSIDICMTAEGAALMPGILHIIDDCNLETLSCLTDAEQRALKAQLLRITEALSDA